MEELSTPVPRSILHTLAEVELTKPHESETVTEASRFLKCPSTETFSETEPVRPGTIFELRLAAFHPIPRLVETVKGATHFSFALNVPVKATSPLPSVSLAEMIE